MLKIGLAVFVILFNSFFSYCQKEPLRLIQLPAIAKDLITEKYKEWEYFNSPVPYYDSTGEHWKYADLIEGNLMMIIKERILQFLLDQNFQSMVI